RTIQRSGVSASASTLAGLPLIVKATVVMSTSPSFGARADMACISPRSLEAARFERPHVRRIGAIGRKILEALQARASAIRCRFSAQRRDGGRVVAAHHSAI